ncbi:nucleoside triphosphate pyrophosphohydrolase [Candidatus Neomarinimicrobiota bacterium]
MKSDNIPVTRQAAVGKKLVGLLSALDNLRAPGGCPWDAAQTAISLVPFLLEETYEVIEAIEAEDAVLLQEELGDLLLHVMFQCKIAEEAGHFTVDETIESLIQKLIDRHPHVFGEDGADGAFQAKQNWEAAKQLKKNRESILEGVPRTLPALTRAKRIQEKAAYVGFDWGEPEPIWMKVYEELNEVKEAIKGGDVDAIEDELGDVLFSLVNLSRFYKVSPEEALRRSISKFEYRFSRIEEELKRRGKSPAESSLEEMDSIWNEYRQKKEPL